MFDLNSARFFAYVVKTKSFSEAAKQLHIPKQTLSRKIAELEEELGIRLLERSTRKLRLTSTGEVFFDYAVQIINIADQANNTLASAQEEPQGTLRLSTSILFCDLTLRHVVIDYMKRYPKVHVHVAISQEGTDVYNNNIDLAILVGPLKDSSLIAKKLLPSRLGCLASPQFLAKYGTPKHPKDLDTAPLISYEDPVYGDPNVWRFIAHDKSHSVSIEHPYLRTSSFWMAREACLQGLAISRLPRTLCSHDIREGSLVEILPEWHNDVGDIYAVFPSRQMLSLQVRCFLEMLQEHLRPYHMGTEANYNIPMQLIEPGLIRENHHVSNTSSTTATETPEEDTHIDIDDDIL